jgi:hypothetical protein
MRVINMLEMDIKQYLLDLGIQDTLLSQLDASQLEGMAEFAIRHHHASHLKQDLHNLASLMLNNVIKPFQARNLDTQQIKEIADTIKSGSKHSDAIVKAAAQAKSFMLYNQENTIERSTGELKMNVKQYLIDLGLKDALLEKLSEYQLESMAEFAINNHNSPHLQKDLIAIASLELNGKEGVIDLIKNNVITSQQAKSLDNKQIREVADTMKNSDISQNIAINNAATQAKNFILYNQQVKIAQITGEDVGVISAYEEGEERIISYDYTLRR